MRKSVYNRTLGGLLDCQSGVTPLAGDFAAVESGGFFASPFFQTNSPDEEEPFSSNGNIVAEKIRVSVSNAIGLRKTLRRPFSLGIATFLAEPGFDANFDYFKWIEIGEIAEWHVIDRLVKFSKGNNKLYCAFKDLNLYYDVAQIDETLDGRPITLDIDLEISKAGGGG